MSEQTAESVPLCDGCHKRPCVCTTISLPKAEFDYAPVELASWVKRDGRFISLWSARDITEPLRLSEQNATTLRHALAGHGLPVSGTKRQQAVRLANAGVSADHVEAWHTWRGRDSGPCSQPVTLPGSTEEVRRG